MLDRLRAAWDRAAHEGHGQREPSEPPSVSDATPGALLSSPDAASAISATPAVQVGQLYVPAHGSGALLRGRTSEMQRGDKKPGSGPSKAKARLRRKHRKLSARLLERIEERLDDLDTDQLIRAAELTSKFGIGTQHEVEKESTHRYVVALPARDPLPVPPLQAPAEVPAGSSRALPAPASENESRGTPGDTP